MRHASIIALRVKDLRPRPLYFTPYLLQIKTASLGNNKRCLECPFSCDEKIDEFVVIRAVASLTPEEMKTVSLKMSKSKECPNPKCGKYYFNSVKGRIRVSCPACDGGDFCVLCERPWKGQGFSICGNDGCNTHHALEEILINCGKKTIGNVKDVPKCRLCPECGSVEHPSLSLSFVFYIILYYIFT